MKINVVKRRWQGPSPIDGCHTLWIEKKVRDDKERLCLDNDLQAMRVHIQGPAGVWPRLSTLFHTYHLQCGLQAAETLGSGSQHLAASHPRLTPHLFLHPAALPEAEWSFYFIPLLTHSPQRHVRPSLCYVPLCFHLPPLPHALLTPTSLTPLTPTRQKLLKWMDLLHKILIFKSLYLPLCFTSWSCPICDRGRSGSTPSHESQFLPNMFSSWSPATIFSTMDILGQLTLLYEELFCAFWMLTNVHPLGPAASPPPSTTLWQPKISPRLGQCPLVGKSSHRRITTLEVRSKATISSLLVGPDVHSIQIWSLSHSLGQTVHGRP